MTLPDFDMDPILLLSLLVIAMALGAAACWILLPHRQKFAPPMETSSDSRLLLHLMSRADHSLDNYITSIQGHLAVLGEELPTDSHRWDVSREA